MPEYQSNNTCDDEYQSLIPFQTLADMYGIFSIKDWKQSTIKCLPYSQSRLLIYWSWNHEMELRDPALISKKNFNANQP